MALIDTTALEQRLAFAIDAARQAGAITLDYFGAPDLLVHTKSDFSPVTEADRQAEKLLRELIGRQYPEDGLLGEEFGESAGTSGARWILDPLDGTKSFVRGVPLYGTLVGWESGGETVLGVVYLPALDELVYAAKGRGAWWVRARDARGREPGSGEGPQSPGVATPGSAGVATPGLSANWRGAAPAPARVSKVSQLSDALFSTTSPTYFHQAGRPELFEQLCRAAALERGWGDCYGYILVATGRADVMVDPVMNPWDCAALKPILEEAGGTFTDLSGTSTIYGGSAVSTNGLLFAQVMAVIHQGGTTR